MSPIYDMDAINNASDDVGKQPGLYYVEIAKAEGKTSQSGNPMVNLELLDVEDRRLLCYDRLMLAGKPFALTMTKKKLQTIGVDVAKPLDPLMLIGKRFWVAVLFGEPNAKGRRYLEPDMRADGSAFGYYPDGHRPGVVDNGTAPIGEAPINAGGAEDVPF